MNKLSLVWSLFAMVASVQTAEAARPLALTEADKAAAIAAEDIHVKTMPNFGHRPISMGSPSGSTPFHLLTQNFRTPQPQATSAGSGPLINHGGAVAGRGQFDFVFINQTSSAWGNPVQFFNDLTTDQTAQFNSQGTFVDMLVQYQYPPSPFRIAFQWNGQAAAGFQNQVSSNKHVLLDSDMRSIARADLITELNTFGAVTSQGVFIFVPPGTDVCMDASQKVCYSPDVPSSFQFCGYHGSFTDSQLGSVRYAVLPFAFVSGCANGGSLSDSQDSVLSHEYFELATDPDLMTWFDTTGQEIADKCFQNFGNVSLNGNNYFIQMEYSNLLADCTFSGAHN